MNATGKWWVDEDEEFGGPLLRWNDRVIAQTTGEEQDGCMEAYQALVDLVRAETALRDEVARLTTETEQLRAARAVLETPDLVRWLDRYGDGPPALMGDEDEVIWRLACFLQSARAAAGGLLQDGDPT